MKKFIPILLLILMLTGCAGDGDQTDSYRQIGMDEAVTMMEEENGYIILDVRTPEEFAEAHIPNAINAPNESIGTDDIPELPDKDQLIMVYAKAAGAVKRHPRSSSSSATQISWNSVVSSTGKARR